MSLSVCGVVYVRGILSVVVKAILQCRAVWVEKHGCRSTVEGGHLCCLLSLDEFYLVHGACGLPGGSESVAGNVLQLTVGMKVTWPNTGVVPTCQW